MRPEVPAFAGLALIGLGGGGVAYLTTLPTSEVRLSGFATRLDGRTRAQRHNAELAARGLNGVTVAPGGTFSFNRHVRGWSLDQGYVRAPVSYDGNLIPAFGGGVCQTSTTLYNAALLAGLPIVERHHHVFAAHYAAPGRDAAVAYPNIDLRFTNPYPFPVRLRTQTTGSELRMEIWGKQRPPDEFRLVSRVLSTSAPSALQRRVSPGPGVPALARTQGATGFRIVTYRVVSRSGREQHRERLSDDAYPAMPEIVRLRRNARTR